MRKTRKIKFNIKYEHREVLNDVKNVIISYTPLSGIYDTAKFFNKWLFKKKKINKVSNHIGRKYRMFRLEQMARKYHSP
ncbi:MAG: hypothetical protein ABR981_01045 [Candidatus Micrarchaeaceae archaeon]|jgi:hypothetical protein